MPSPLSGLGNDGSSALIRGDSSQDQKVVQTFQQQGLAAALTYMYSVAGKSGVDLSGVDLTTAENLMRNVPPGKILDTLYELASNSMDTVTAGNTTNDDRTSAVLSALQGANQHMNLGLNVSQDSVASTSQVDGEDALQSYNIDQEDPNNPPAPDADPGSSGGPGGGIQTQLPNYQSGTETDPSQDFPATQGQGTPGQAGYVAGSPGHDTARLQDLNLGDSPDAQDYQRITGHDPKQAYDDYSASFKEGGRRGTPMPYAQWIGQQAQTAMGPIYTAVRNLQGWYQNKYGSVMPDALRAQIEQYFQNNPSEAAIAQSQALAAGTSTSTVPTSATSVGSASAPTSGTTNIDPAALPGQALSQLLSAGDSIVAAIPALSETIANYQAANPDPNLEAANIDATNRVQFHNATGHDPTAAELTTMRSMSSDQLTTFLDQQNVQGTNLTAGQYGAAKSLANSLWSKYFTGAPTDSDIQHIAGFKDAQQATQWVESQPSHISGVNVGDYTGISNTVSSLSSEYWHSPATPDLMNHVTSKLQGQ